MPLDPFLQAILVEPEDDTHRLVYADWLDEHGNSDRAEFIRVQCELARLDLPDRTMQRLRRRMQALLKQHAAEWAGSLRERECYWYVGFERGFVSSVRQVEAQEFLNHLPDFFDWHPLQVVELIRTQPGHLSAIAACPQLARLKKLHFYGGNFAPGEDHALAGSPFLVGLERLRIEGNNFSPDGLKALAASPYLSRLRDLELSSTEVGSAGAEALAASTRLPQLRSLSLYGSAVDERGIEALAGGPLIGQLISLNLGYNPIGETGAIALARSPHLQHLERWNLSQTQITEAGFQALAASSTLSTLKELVLAGEGTFTPAAIRYLAESPYLGGLEEVNLSSPDLGAVGAQALARARWNRLHTLWLGKCGIGDAGLRALAESPLLGKVTRLWLTDNRIGDEGALALAKSPHVNNLKDLDLRGNRVSKEVRQIVRDRFGKRNCRFTW
jgi:uncharacterized protein (TIGR02996 family)